MRLTEREIRARCQLQGEFTLRSGKVSSTYFDKYLLLSDPIVLKDLAEGFVELLPSDTEVLAGVEMGGIPLVTAISLLSSLPAVYVRKERKTYGTEKIIEGYNVEGKRVAVFEDVITSGYASAAAIRDLRKGDAIVEDIHCIIQRGEATWLKDINVQIHPLFRMEE